MSCSLVSVWVRCLMMHWSGAPGAPDLPDHVLQILDGAQHVPRERWFLCVFVLFLCGVCGGQVCGLWCVWCECGATKT